MLFTLMACSKSNDKEHFAETYKNILIAREMGTDSIATNQQVNKILLDAGYTEKEFRQEFMEYAKDRQAFVQFLSEIKAKADAVSDSIRKSEHETRK